MPRMPLEYTLRKANTCEIVTGEPDTWKHVRPVRWGTNGKGQECTSPVVYPTSTRAEDRYAPANTREWHNCSQQTRQTLTEANRVIPFLRNIRSSLRHVSSGQG